MSYLQEIKPCWKKGGRKRQEKCHFTNERCLSTRRKMKSNQSAYLHPSRDPLDHQGLTSPLRGNNSTPTKLSAATTVHRDNLVPRVALQRAPLARVGGQCALLTAGEMLSRSSDPNKNARQKLLELNVSLATIHDGMWGESSAFSFRTVGSLVPQLESQCVFLSSLSSLVWPHWP